MASSRLLLRCKQREIQPVFDDFVIAQPAVCIPFVFCVGIDGRARNLEMLQSKSYCSIVTISMQCCNFCHECNVNYMCRN